MIKDLEFVQYISARFCHDLAGALGAISNGVEFVSSEDVDVRGKALDLINLSSRQANSILRFLRYAYGIAKYDGDADIGQMKTVCSDILQDKNINLEFLIPNSLQPEKAIDVNTGKLIVCIIAFAKSELIYGGSINITINHDENRRKRIDIVAQGKDIKIKVDMNKIILGDTHQREISTTNIDAYYINRLKDFLNLEIDIREEPNKITYSIEEKK
jgi:histidine phosphotransferase ChpT